MTAEADEIGPLRIGRVAHGGHWVARDSDGRVIFVRGALEGELVRVRLTAVASRHAFADTIEVLEASPDRVRPPCAIAAHCGGCDFQHVDPAAQIELKRQVVAEQLGRLAGFDWTGSVERVEPILRWRTRVRYHASATDWGMHPHRSHAVVPLPAEGCLIAAPGLARPPLAEAPHGELRGVRDADGVHWSTATDRRPTAPLTEKADGRRWAVEPNGFWQVHPSAADTLVSAVIEGLGPVAGESALDLYCGVGLFAGALAARGVRVEGVEGDRSAVALARRNVPRATFRAGRVDDLVFRLTRPDLVVLDPPRTGAGAAVLDAVLGFGPRAVAYVACDPAALSRDLGRALRAGWSVASLRAFDLFPMTHHIECVAILTRDRGLG